MFIVTSFLLQISTNWLVSLALWLKKIKYFSAFTAVQSPYMWVQFQLRVQVFRRSQRRQIFRPRRNQQSIRQRFQRKIASPTKNKKNAFYRPIFVKAFQSSALFIRLCFWFYKIVNIKLKNTQKKTWIWWTNYQVDWWYLNCVCEFQISHNQYPFPIRFFECLFFYSLSIALSS